jgi:hypothetical protein
MDKPNTISKEMADDVITLWSLTKLGQILEDTEAGGSENIDSECVQAIGVAINRMAGSLFSRACDHTEDIRNGG